MKYDPNRHRRRSIRLQGYDYTQAGAYFVTICAQDRVCLFGEVVGGVMRLSEAGQMVATEWDALPTRFPAVELDAFVIMPNHIHGIIAITPVGAGLVPAPLPPARLAPADGATTHRATTHRATTRVAPTLGDIVGAFKSLTTVRYLRGVKQSGWPAVRGRLWQRNYYEHIIRNDESLNRIREYIAGNPARWAFDRENPEAVAPDGEGVWHT